MSTSIRAGRLSSGAAAAHACASRRRRDAHALRNHLRFTTAMRMKFLFGTFIGGTTQLSLHDFFGCADNLFLLSHLCSSGHGAWGQCVPCWGASKTPNTKQIMVGLPAQLPKTQVSFSTLNFEPRWHIVTFCVVGTCHFFLLAGTPSKVFVFQEKLANKDERPGTHPPNHGPISLLRTLSASQT